MTAINAADSVGDRSRWFYAWMAMACLAIAVVGFVPTYFVPLTRGAAFSPPFQHIHGLLFFGWMIFFCTQTWLVATGRAQAHRDWGMLGVALATAMVASVFVIVGIRINAYANPEFAAGMRAFSWVQVSGMIFFGSVVALAIANVKKPDIHKRLMLLATIGLLDAPIARWFLVAMGGLPPAVNGEIPPPPVFVDLIPGALSVMFLLVPIIFDWRTRGRPHPVYMIGAGVLVAKYATLVQVSQLAAWDSAARWIAGLGG
ncbi:hypothetical protein [Vitreimonas flagellata]|uniref:hypothetical protein n=1 Tax=Vitreimonas flagellata TaxID=2560861 RepID=UPI001075233C|nr:hypothetical protein [Vitreimonas flagellata]